LKNYINDINIFIQYGNGFKNNKMQHVINIKQRHRIISIERETEKRIEL